jgi:hypothetical protein
MSSLMKAVAERFFCHQLRSFRAKYFYDSPSHRHEVREAADLGAHV